MRLRIAMLFIVGVLPWAQNSAQGQVSRSVASRMGMETAWRSQVQLPRIGGLVSSHIWAEPENPRKFAIVELPSKTIRVSADQLDRRGSPIGMEEAKRQAQEQAARLLGKSDGFQVLEVSVPRLKLVLVTSDGLVQTLDAESGKLLWSSMCGHSSAPAYPAAVSSAGVSVIHGEALYLFDWETGKQRMSQPLRYATSNAIAVCNDIAFVSDFTGRVEAYGLGEPRAPWGYAIHGRSIGRTVNLASQRFCAIASDLGYVYIFAGGEEPSVWIRYESSSPIFGSLSAGNGAFYAGNERGAVSKISVEDRFGQIEWEFRTGRSIAAPPLVVGERIIVASMAGDVISIDDVAGQEQWFTRAIDVAQPIGIAGDTVFCISTTGELVALDASSGTVIARSASRELSQPVINPSNDRVYLVRAGGQIQCLRPIGRQLPTMHRPVQPAEQNGDTPLGEPMNSPNESPFIGAGPGAVGADPFASGDAPTMGDDPFGGDGANPFGDAGGETNPFGGDDPFGTDN